jgi:hypothetical protein
MKFKHLSRVTVLGVVCLIGMAAGGLSWAMAAGPQASVADASNTNIKCIKFDTDDQSLCGIMRRGPKGIRGPNGIRGKLGAKGNTGATGNTGAQGLTGPKGDTGGTGVKGDTGAQGNQGIQGVQGAPGHTVVVAGTQVSKTGGAGGEPQGELLPATVAQCPAPSSGTPEAYGGGVTIQKSGAQSTGDVVTIQQHFLGTFVSSTSVSPLPAGSTPGTVSTQAANAYEGQAVVTQLNAGDSVVAQAYVVCGP